MNPRNLAQRVIGAALGVALFVSAFIFASVILAIAAAAALIIWGWFWWRTRAIRRAARESGGIVIEGESRVERDVGRLDDDERAPPP